MKGKVSRGCTSAVYYFRRLAKQSKTDKYFPQTFSSDMYNISIFRLYININIYVCICIYMYIYICVYIYIYMYIYVYVYIYMYIYTHTHTCVCMYIHIYINLSAGTWRCVEQRKEEILESESTEILSTNDVLFLRMQKSIFRLRRRNSCIIVTYLYSTFHNLISPRVIGCLNFLRYERGRGRVQRE